MIENKLLNAMIDNRKVGTLAEMSNHLIAFEYDNEEKASWKLSPAYDLTYSNSIGGEHATTVDGEGMNPGMKEILSVAMAIKMDVAKAANIAEEIETVVSSELKDYLKV